ncbi:MAG: class IV adenylate cyclase [Vicinamibacteria bacterium]
MGIGVEREVKFLVSSWSQGETLLTGAAGRIREARYWEVNSLFDFPDGSLRAKGQALRVRRARGGAWLTLKEPAPGGGRLKHRKEYESTVADADAIEGILCALGMVEQFRYEKYRQVYDLGDLEACLDETPIGCYIELEGSAESVHDVAERLGLSQDDRIVLSYPELYEDHRRRFAEAPSFMVFPDEARS